MELALLQSVRLPSHVLCPVQLSELRVHLLARTGKYLTCDPGIEMPFSPTFSQLLASEHVLPKVISPGICPRAGAKPLAKDGSVQ